MKFGHISNLESDLFNDFAKKLRMFQKIRNLFSMNFMWANFQQNKGTFLEVCNAVCNAVCMYNAVCNAKLHIWRRFQFFGQLFLKGFFLIKLKLISFFNARYLTVSLWGPVLNLTARAKPDCDGLDGLDGHGKCLLNFVILRYIKH